MTKSVLDSAGFFKFKVISTGHCMHYLMEKERGKMNKYKSNHIV